MITPGIATPMWAIQDRKSGVYLGPPIPGPDEALATLLAWNSGKSPAEISAKFHVVAVTVTVIERATPTLTTSQQARLFAVEHA